MKHKYILTTWRTATYDVWGNAKDGYEVNDRYHGKDVQLKLRVETANTGTPQAFEYAFPTNAQIRDVFSLRRIKLETDGDDILITVNAARDGYPCGELECISHESLSPIREKELPNKLA